MAVILIAVFSGLAGFITDYLWFKDLSYTDVFWKQLLTQLKIGIPVFIVLTVLGILYLKSLRKGYRKRVTIETETASAKMQSRIGLILAAAASAVVAFLAATGLWFESLQFIHSKGFGLDDPIFGNDISFYVFKLQFIRNLNTIVIEAIIAFAIITFVYYFFLLSVAKPKIIERAPDSEESSSGFGGGDAMGGIIGDLLKSFGLGGGAAGQSANRPKPADGQSSLRELIHIASKQITVLGVLFFLMVGVNYFLKQFDLLYSSNGVVFGAGFTDINITLWTYRVIFALSAVAAVLFVIGMKKKKVRTVLTVPVIMIAVGLLGTGIGFSVQQLIVSPDEINKEQKYLDHNIEFTQSAYDLQNVSVRPFEADNNLTGDDIKANMDTIRNIRINDYDPAKTFYNSTQTIRQYYTFNDVDVDRYMINGAYTQTFLSAREIDETKIPQQWINLHLQYTHGYGITLSRVDKVTASGQPDIMIKDIPPVSSVDEINVTRPEIYFGELQNQYILTNTSEEEFNYLEGDKNVPAVYEGKTGIRMNAFNRLMFAIKERSMKLFVSTNIKSDSKIIINRNIRERVREIMPYMDYSDPYMVTVDGKLYWIIDGYTMSSMYPYSEPYDMAAGNPTNYIRNSVKVVIDAYDGATDYYLVDESDPVANTLKSIYPTLFDDFAEMPEGLRSHIRYPSKMLTVQANIYKKYHVNDYKVFYQGADRWDIANEKLGASDKEVAMQPNYYIIKLPGEEKAEFINSIPYTPMNKVNMAALLVARNDGEHYGELILYQMPKGKTVMGPSQIDAQIAQDTTISRDFALWENSGSTYSRGNMFVVPINESIMYVEPIYLKASEGSLPEVKRIIIYYGDRIAYETTLAEALDSMFGPGTGDAIAITDPTGDTGDADSGPDDTGTGGDSQQMTTDQIIRAAVEAYNSAVQAQKDGDWAKYGQEMKRMEGYLYSISGEGEASTGDAQGDASDETSDEPETNGDDA
ncbi:MAG: UPF0182 family protein [Clostridiales Family XIII bacterium]|nr:UPF0182 family protein [Clostridiales Family XIII bacterium]